MTIRPSLLRRNTALIFWRMRIRTRMWLECRRPIAIPVSTLLASQLSALGRVLSQIPNTYSFTALPASQITYTILESDRDMPFTIDSKTGEIKIARERYLDYEATKQVSKWSNRGSLAGLPCSLILRMCRELKIFFHLQYTIKVRADDGIYNDDCEVHITVQNVNDNAPVFDSFPRNLTIIEEEMKDDCLTVVMQPACTRRRRKSWNITSPFFFFPSGEDS